MSAQEKQIRKEVRKQLFNGMPEWQFNNLRRMYYACLWLKQGGVTQDNENPILQTYEISRTFENQVLAQYRELRDCTETIEWKCCKDLYCIDFMNKAMLQPKWSWEKPTVKFTDALDTCETKIVARISNFEQNPWDIRRREFTNGECCFLLYLHPEVNLKTILILALLPTPTVDMKKAREQGIEHNKKSQEQEMRRQKHAEQNASRHYGEIGREKYHNSKPRKPGSGFTMSPEELRNRINGSKLMGTRRIK